MMTYLMDMKVTMVTMGHFDTQRMSIHLAGCLMHCVSTCSIEFREGIVFKNFREFAWALKDYCIQQNFKGMRIKFERKRILCGCYADKCPFRVYVALQNWGKCFQIRTLHNIHTCKGLDNNLKVTEAWITRKYHNKVLANPKIGVDILVDDLKKKMHGVTVAPQKVYRAKRRILKSAMVVTMLRVSSHCRIMQMSSNSKCQGHWPC